MYSWLGLVFFGESLGAQTDWSFDFLCHPKGTLSGPSPNVSKTQDGPITESSTGAHYVTKMDTKVFELVAKVCIPDFCVSDGRSYDIVLGIPALSILPVSVLGERMQ